MLVDSKLTGRRLVSLPFCDECHPLIAGEEEGSRLLASMLSDMEQKKASRLEIRGWTGVNASPNMLLPSNNYVRHAIDLSRGPDAVFARFNANMRRSIRRAKKEGVTVRFGEGRRDMETFISLNLKLRRRHAMLPQPRRFFEAIWRNVLDAGLGYLLLAERKDVALGALVVFQHRETALDKFAVSDSAYWNFSANHLLLWKSLQIECKRGGVRYDLGRSDLAAVGLHRFKEGAGGIRSSLPYYYFPQPAGESLGDPKGPKKRLLDVFTKLAPDSLFEKAGGLLYRHVG